MAKRKARSTTKRGFFNWISGLILAIVGIGPISGYEWVIHAYEWLRNNRPTTIEETRNTPSTPNDGLVRAYFTTPELTPEKSVIAAACVGYIDQTKQTLDVAAFELDNRVITDAIVRAAKRGVRVRIVTETNYLHESGIAAVKAVGIPVIDDQRDGALMHHKFMVFDQRAVWMGSMNFTENCAYRNNNNGVFIDSVEIAKNYSTKFSWMFDLRKFGGAPSKWQHIPSPVVKLADGTIIENYFSTHDRVADRVIAETSKAKQSIHFLAFSFTHDGISRSMLSRANAGVEVQGVFERTQAASGYSAYERLRSAGSPVNVFYDANPRNMHHKVIIIDQQTVITGSFNFSESADKSNDENIVIIRNNPQMAQAFEEEFQRVYGAARSKDGR